MKDYGNLGYDSELIFTGFYTFFILEVLLFYSIVFKKRAKKLIEGTWKQQRKG
jgi:hypothetical protein